MYVTIFRVQDTKGQGPYTGDKTNYDYMTQRFCWSRRSHEGANLPSPDAENLLRTDRHLCGFESLKQLHKWFTDYELKNLKELGFTIHQIEVLKSSVQFGKQQLIFNSKEVVK